MGSSCQTGLGVAQGRVESLPSGRVKGGVGSQRGSVGEVLFHCSVRGPRLGHSGRREGESDPADGWSECMGWQLREGLLESLPFLSLDADVLLGTCAHHESVSLGSFTHVTTTQIR